MYYLIVLIHFILFVELIYGENSKILSTVATRKPISTFVTLVDQSYVTPYYINNKDEHNQLSNTNNNTLYHIFNGLNLNFEQVKLILIGFILILIILIIIVLVIIKKFTNCCLFNYCLRRCLCGRNNNISKTDSNMSGECGCVMRFRKNNKNNNNNINKPIIEQQEQQQHDVNNSKSCLLIQNQTYPKLKRLISVSLNELDEMETNYFDKYKHKNVKTVKSALVLIAINNKSNNEKSSYDQFESVNDLSTDKLVTRTIISEEDLNEYAENFLIINMQKDLVLLDNINKLKRLS